MPAPGSGRLVTLALPPGSEFSAALESAWEQGDAVLPLDPSAPPEVRERLVAAMRPDLPVEPGTALVIATSGSTGEPKGVLLSHEALASSARATHERIGVEPGDGWLSCLPWHHIGGLQTMLRARLLGLPLTVHERFDVGAVAGADATLVSLVPTQLLRLLDAGVDLSRFRVVLLGGAAAPPSLLARARSAGAPVVTTYGMSETSGGCVYDGHPLPRVDVRVGDDGRVRLRGPVLTSGYRARPDLTEQSTEPGGWWVTNDVGTVDVDGRLVVQGRVDDVVVTGGENVATGRVADVVSAHPGVVEAAVTGVADPQWGQRVVAVAVVRDRAPLSLAELREWAADRLTPAELPRSLVVVDELPRLGSGKLDRLALRRLAGAG